MLIESKMQSSHFLDILVIKKKSDFYVVWRWLDFIVCLISSYFYAYLGVYFEEPITKELNTIVILAQSFFFIDMVVSLLTEYVPADSNIPVRQIKLVAMNYIKGSFMFDLILWVPIEPVFGHLNDDIRRFYIIKCLRMIKSLRQFKVTALVKMLKEMYRRQV